MRQKKILEEVKDYDQDLYIELSEKLDADEHDGDFTKTLQKMV
ncbi:hypothetical protein [uncultured phage MedDCM-OCT-S08-C582]|nr:hypothetical protein [uncultured phage MedDCM-OCT-S08-C582]